MEQSLAPPIDSGEVTVDISPSPANHNAELLVVSIIRDVTQRKQAEEALRQRTRRGHLRQPMIV
ncbi:MAG: PAS domain S-box protein [Brevundimonas sp.]|nr:PAS domain S-box protein [Brevundimonas sp.]